MRRSWGQTALVIGFTLALTTAAFGESLYEPAAAQLPEGAIKQLWTKAPDNSSTFAPLTFAPDNKILALGSGETVVLWDVATGKELRTLKGHTDAVAGLAFAPDGKTLASAALDRTVRLWDVADGKERHRLAGHKEAVLAVAFAPDGKQLASAGQDKIIRLWDAASGDEVRQLAGHQSGVHTLAFSPDGKTLASAGKDRLIRLWEPVTGKEVRQLKGHQNRVNTVVFASDGKTLASASQDSTIRLWSVAEGKETRRLAGWTGEVRSLAFSGDGRTLASVSRDYTVRLWELLTTEERRSFRSDSGDFVALALSGDGKVLASSRPGAATLWDVTGLLRAGQAMKVNAAPDDLDRLWGDLARDATRANDAGWRLAAVGEQAVPFLTERLVAQQNFDDPKRIVGLIADLYSDRFAVRSRASDELEALAGIARPALEKELAKRPSLDVKRRIDHLLELADAVAVPPFWLRAVRGVETLERVGTPEARQALEKLTLAPEGSRLATEAAESLRRLKSRK